MAPDQAGWDEADKSFLAARAGFLRSIDDLGKVADEPMRKMLGPVQSQFAAVVVSQDKGESARPGEVGYSGISDNYH